MFRALLLKELRDHLLSLRFQAGFALAVLLVSVSAFVLASGYERTVREQTEQRMREDEILRRYAHLNRFFAFLFEGKPPSPIVMVRGLEADSLVETLDSNPMPQLFPAMDLASIAGLIFSLFGIMLGFDAVNGERESGTLRLVLSNGVRRFTVLGAKWAGGMAVLAVATAAALAAGCAIILARAGTHWNTDDWLSALGLYLVPLVYTGVFFSLALAFSAVARRSSASVIASVFAWVLLALVVPNITPYAAAKIVPLPSLAALQRDTDYITSEERDAEINREWRDYMRRHAGDPDFEQASAEKQSPAVERRLATDPGFKALFTKIRQDYEKLVTDVNKRQGEKADRLREAYNALSRRQFELSRRISYVSPMPPFIYAATELALTGFDEKKRTLKQYREYGEALHRYLFARYAEEQKKNPSFGYNDFMDVSTRPRLAYRFAASADRVNSALPYAGMLLAWNALFVFAAVAGFQRFDVR